MILSNGPLIEPDVLRKKASGTVFGSMPAPLTCDAKFVICATTRQGTVTGEITRSLSTGTPWPLCTAASMAVRSVSNSPVVVASVSILAASSAVWTHQPSMVRRIEVVMSWLLSRAEGLFSNRRCRDARCPECDHQPVELKSLECQCLFAPRFFEARDVLESADRKAQVQLGQE